MNTSTNLSSRVFAIDSAKKGQLFVKEKTSGYVLDGINASQVKNISLILISESVADKVLYSLSGIEVEELVLRSLNINTCLGDSVLAGLVVDSSEKSAFVIPFALGDLQLSDNDFLRIDIEMASNFSQSSINYDRYLLGKDATNPIFVKKQKQVFSIDSENFDAIVLDSKTSITYFRNGQKVFLPAGLLHTLACYQGTSMHFKPIKNLTYEFKDAVDVLLMEF